MKVGAYYWDGWSKYHAWRQSERLRTEFADREPVWGWTSDTVESMELEIQWAAGAGLRFFAFDWYYPEREDKEDPMNIALGQYLEAENRDLLEFCLLVANHKGFRIYQKDWSIVVEKWLPYLSHEGHLRIDGKPLLIVFSPHEIDQCFKDDKAIRDAFESLQRAAVGAGLSGVSIAGCERGVVGDEFRARLEKRREQGYTHFTGYNYHGGSVGEYEIHPYGEMADDHRQIWDAFAQCAPLPYLPVVTAGWDCRPWNRPSWYYPDRTPEQVAGLVRAAGEWMDSHPDKTSPDEVMLIYAWNEYGEGGFIAPHKGDGGRYLKVLQPLLVS